MRRPLFLAIVIVLSISGLAALLVLEWRFGLGGFASSPQLLEVRFGGTVIVGGGRAVLWVGMTPFPVAGPDARPLPDPEMAACELRCRGERKVFRLSPGERSDRICGVEVSLRALRGGANPDEPRRAELEVVWED